MFDMSGGSAGTSCTSLSAALRQAVKDPGVGSIVLDIDSPGGDVEGVDELASEIYAARKQKKTPLRNNPKLSRMPGRMYAFSLGLSAGRIKPAR